MDELIEYLRELALTIEHNIEGAYDLGKLAGVGFALQRAIAIRRREQAETEAKGE